MILNREPTAIISAVRAVLYCVVLFGLDLSDEQVIGILGAAEAVLFLINRSQVTPVGTAENMADKAHAAGLAGKPAPTS